jgi:cytochrome P450
MMIDYIAPSLDTTIYAMSSAIYLFARNPDQWDLLRTDPTLVPHAINEALRLESPVQRFTRLVTEDHKIDGFDIRRKPSDQLAFGRGEHVCIGMGLARIEMRALLEALIPRVRRFDLTESELALNNTLRGFGTLRVRVS